jgi:hypothetical protein
MFAHADATLPQSVLTARSSVQDASLGRVMIARALQEPSVASFKQRLFGEATAAAQAELAEAPDVSLFCSFARYYTELAGLLSRQPSIGEVTI